MKAQKAQTNCLCYRLLFLKIIAYWS